MAAHQNGPGAQMNFEKELSCSICTDILFQPLTLLDCLHTFCGACLKEWFLSQASRATSIHPYTCPSCRASVRGTNHNAGVATFLEMFLKSYPEKERAAQDKEEQMSIYKPGDNVLPRLRRRVSPEDEEEQRLIDEVRELSLREVGLQPGAADSSRNRQRERRGRSRETRARDARENASSRQVGLMLHSGTDDRARARPRSQQNSRQHTPPRNVEHQSSLRSLLSSSDLDSQELDDEIMQIMEQILQDGVLDGINPTDIEFAREDQLSELIVQAYRQRQEERRGASLARPGDGRTRPRARTQDRSRDRRRLSPHLDSASHQRQASGGGDTRRRRRNSESNNRPAPDGTQVIRIGQASSSAAAQSTGDLPASQHLSVNAGSERRPRGGEAARRTTDPSRRPQPSSRTADSEPAISAAPGTRPRSRRGSDAVSDGLRTQDAAGPVIRRSPRIGAGTFPTDARSSSSTTTAHTAIRDQAMAAAASSHEDHILSSPTSVVAPSLRCRRCPKQNIEREVHYNCPKCAGGDFNLCLRCYRHREGCDHWFGFGWAAWGHYERMKQSVEGQAAQVEAPHVLTARRYVKASSETAGSTGSDRSTTAPVSQTSSLQTGVFCDLCQSFANDWYWKCGVCNEGEWGFCNPCVRQGKHCTHHLLSLKCEASSTPPTHYDDGTIGATALPSAQSSPSSPPSTTSAIRSPPLSPTTASAAAAAVSPPNGSYYRFLPRTFTTTCDLCKYPIPPSSTRFHCPTCNAGDYDVCTACYRSLVSSGRIAPHNGHHGWRRCLAGHRMVVVGFEDRDGAQRRVVAKDLVGGWTLRDDGAADGPSSSSSLPPASSSPSSSFPPSHDDSAPGHPGDGASGLTWSWTEPDGSRGSRTVRASAAAGGAGAATRLTAEQAVFHSAGFPPDGGVGLRFLAKWAWFPAADDEGAADELLFPRGAEIREAEDLNGDWCWGVYAGRKGLFPAGYARVVG